MWCVSAGLAWRIRALPGSRSGLFQGGRRLGAVSVLSNSSALPSSTPFSVSVPTAAFSTAGPKKPADKGKGAGAAHDGMEGDGPTSSEMLRTLGSYLWPSGPESFGLKARVVASVGLLVGGKLVNIQARWFLVSSPSSPSWSPS